MAEICAWCQEKEATEHCDTCDNDFCENCLEEHEHCRDCGGRRIIGSPVLRDESGNLDYLHGQPTGEIQEIPCMRCEETGLEI